MATPVQRQYWELKNQNPEAVLFFRLGDFYELFFEDAHIGSKVLGITLTARHKGTENEMPMAGFPHHAHKDYLEKLIETGYKVAIAEQREDDEGKISRYIARLVTPGSTLETGTLKPDAAQYLLALEHNEAQQTFALAYADVSTGEFCTAQFKDEARWWDELYKLAPKEILLSTTDFNKESLTRRLPKALFTPRPEIKIKAAVQTLSDHFPANHLNVAGIDKMETLLVLSARVLNYLADTQKTELRHINQIKHSNVDEVMALDAQTFRHLEIFGSLNPGEHNATLWQTLKRPYSAPGGRLLRYWLCNPLIDLEKINRRLSAVQELGEKPNLRTPLEAQLKTLPDLERLLARLSSGRGNARDLAFFRDAFTVFPELAKTLQLAEADLIGKTPTSLSVFGDLTELLQKALVENPPLEITQGGMFTRGFKAELDTLLSLTQDSKTWLENYVETCRKQTGITHLKATYSRNFGFTLEVSKSHAGKAPESWTRRQTLVNAERFTTPELTEYETKALSAEAESFALEHRLFIELKDEVLKFLPQIQTAAQNLAIVDALLSLSRTARAYRWTAPTLRNDVGYLNIQGGKHPVVEQLSTESFVANNLKMNPESRFHLISGPNMAGKSTFLRQNALIILLAQIGSFVPAKKAELSLYDRIFTRVGASDNLAAGQSTFFVEMAETARILHAATPKSFVVLDEIGRGTSTFDGISLAWAITESLHNDLKANTLFATHYHELIDLAEDLNGAANWHVSVTQNEDGIVFLRHIKPGGISDSFGIEVAKLAGVPESVVQNAREVLRRLESESLLSGKPNLFSTAAVTEKVVEVPAYSAVESYLADINPDDLSPKEALEMVYKLKNL
ncbi:DNA mismatch repair protein MutS [bacterium]|nr:DNA mismatch repair protein MutS [bacterium]NCQ55093.1 DNA mismatch repair protein MutS [Candidatus Parcubacteria bacterium]NCS67137.1 DNA mismatch repair protein MutS [Candidatus Peregrinibacteria bacterium]NCS96083.1 DNA mismatch repair protein MutS [bacterium]